MLLPYDELNVLRSRVEESRTADGKLPADLVEDIVFDYLLFSYALGVDNANEMMRSSFVAKSDEARETIYRRTAGKTFAERVRAYAETGDTDSIMRVAETEATRDMNTAAERTAVKAGAKNKTWITMEDGRVRDTHYYLHGVTVPIGGVFVTYDGDSARSPGGFGRAENNANCRCVLTFS
ncbi:MAG: hypothetical protein J6S14_21935 [Clostridia bacterium]|nr:hypothetical protein [Clostridia bacterium]